MKTSILAATVFGVLVYFFEIPSVIVAILSIVLFVVIAESVMSYVVEKWLLRLQKDMSHIDGALLEVDRCIAILAAEPNAQNLKFITSFNGIRDNLQKRYESYKRYASLFQILVHQPTIR